MPGEQPAAAAPIAVRRYAPGDEAAILDLFARSFHAPRSHEHFEWKYRNNPFGNERIALGFTAGGELAGHYAGYPVPFRDGRERYLAHQIGDTMTAVSFRHVGRGPSSILGRTALSFYETFCDGQIAFNYGFNVSNIQKFSLRFLRSDRVEPVPYRIRPAAALRATPALGRVVTGISVDVATGVTEAFDRFLQRVAPAYGFLVDRSATYLRWRYFRHPELRYVVLVFRKWGVLAGWSVFVEREGRIRWGDALFDPTWPEGPSLLLDAALQHFGVLPVECWFPARPVWFDRLLVQLGFLGAPEPQNLSLMCVPFVKRDAVARMREALYYTMGDSDLF